MKTEIVTARNGPSETESVGEELAFCSNPNLDVGHKSYDFSVMKEIYASLTNLPDIRVSMAVVKVILGQDAYHLIRSFEYKSGDSFGPCAVTTSLGWTVGEALPKTETNCMATSCNLSVTSDSLADNKRNGGT